MDGWRRVSKLLIAVYERANCTGTHHQKQQPMLAESVEVQLQAPARAAGGRRFVQPIEHCWDEDSQRSGCSDGEQKPSGRTRTRGGRCVKIRHYNHTQQRILNNAHPHSHSRSHPRSHKHTHNHPRNHTHTDNRARTRPHSRPRRRRRRRRRRRPRPCPCPRSLTPTLALALAPTLPHSYTHCRTHSGPCASLSQPAVRQLAMPPTANAPQQRLCSAGPNRGF